MPCGTLRIAKPLGVIFMMKTTIYLFILLALTISCSQHQIEETNADGLIVFLTETKDPELLADIEYVSGELEKYYSTKEIIVMKTSSRTFTIHDKEYKNFDLPDSLEIGILLFRFKDKSQKLITSLGTDVDLVQEINPYFDLE